MAVKFTPGVVSGDGDEAVTVTPVSQANNEIKFVVDVYREHSAVTEVYRGRREVDVVRPGGTVVNIGAGPVLPPNPYEGQVWILT